MIKPRKKGIIQSIILLVEACLGSLETGVVIFCCTQVETPTSTGRTSWVELRSGMDRSSQRNELFKGIEPWTIGSQE